ncbi:MAG TPA: hypothetical protein VGL06_30445 [Pseudonocardiaceae bacterium]
MGNTYSAPDIYHRIRGGRGSGGFSSNGAMTEQQSGLQSQINKQVTDLNNKMNASWTGNASDQAVSGAAPLATSSDSASTALNQASDAMHNQVGSFHTAYNSVVPMSNAAPQNNLLNEMVSGLGVSTPLDQQISSYNAAGQQNVQVYNNYSTQSSVNAAAMPTDFGTLPNPHPDVTVIPGPNGPTGGPSYTGSVGPGGTGGSTPPSAYRSPGGPRAGGGPVWTNPGEPTPVGSSGGPGPGGGVWEPPPTTIQSTAPPSMEFPLGGGMPSGGVTDPNFPNGMGPLGSGLPPNEDGTSGGRGSFNPLTGEWTSGEPGFGGSGGFGGAGGTGGFGGAGGSGGIGTGTSGGAGSSGTSGSGSSSGTGITSGAEEAAFGRPGGLGGGMGGGPGAMGGGRSAKGDEDEEHKTAEYLQEADPDAIFGTDQMTVPPVIGE